MFMKLTQRSPGWWLCVTTVSVLSGCILTILIYPAYAALASGVCDRDSCVRGCGPCRNANGTWADGLGPEGAYAFQADVIGFAHWKDGNKCEGRATTYHRSYVKNMQGGNKRFTWRYKALFFQIGGEIEANCVVQGIVPDNPNSFTVPLHQSRTNTYTQSQIYTLGPPQGGCKYRVQAVTQFSFPDSHGWDIQSSAPNPSFVACP